MDDAEERRLIQRAKSEAEAFGLLYQRYVARIFNYHYRHTANQADAEDLTSQTFYRAMRSLGTYREREGATFQAWLFRIAHNLVANWYRDHSRHPTVDLENAPPLYSGHANPEQGLEASESRQALMEIIESLPEDRKTLLLLKFVEHLSNAEIAQVLGKTEGAIKALYHRTLISLRHALPEEVEDDEEP